MPLPERQFIASLRGKVPPRPSAVAHGIGDDCAVLRIPSADEALITTDFSLEGVHFRRDWQSPECIGHRCLARGLSDIAAMGGRPIAAFLSLALPPKLPQRWADRFLSGLLALAGRYGVVLAGGDTAQSPNGILADMVVLGGVSRGKSLLRSGARAGDRIYVTGELGESATALLLIADGKIKKRDIFPEPRIAVGAWLGKNRAASAAIDISDGLSTDLAHICRESGVGAVIDARAIPIHPLARKGARAGGGTSSSANQALDLALHGGEDYELLFTAPPSKRIPTRIAGVNITRIGEICSGKKMTLLREGKSEELPVKGWQHFG